MAEKIIEIEKEHAKLYEKTFLRKKEVCARPILELTKKAEEKRVGSLITPILPQDTKLYLKDEKLEVVVIEQPPQVRTVFWSNYQRESTLGLNEEDFNGRIKKYTLSFPFVIFFFGFLDKRLTTEPKCFFRNAPIENIDDRLSCAVIKNVRRDDHKICTGVNLGLLSSCSDIFLVVKEVIDVFWASIFNSDLDAIDGFSLVGRESGGIFGIRSIEEWAEKTLKNPDFVLTSVNWPVTTYTVGGLINKVLNIEKNHEPSYLRNSQLDRVSNLADIMYCVESTEQIPKKEER